MSHRRRSLKKLRDQAFQEQNGTCCYCKSPMWKNAVSQFAREHGISEKQARQFQCTSEHLTPHSEGGSAARANIAAACVYCNRRRHARKARLGHGEFHLHVQKRLRKGVWNTRLMTGD